MTLKQAILAVFICTVAFSLIGLSIGAGIGTFAPDYYRNIFTRGHDPSFDPLSVGIGLGITQGTSGGVVIGLIIVALLCIRDIYVAPRNLSEPPKSPLPLSTTQRLVRFFVLTFAIFGGTVFLAIAAVIGIVAKERWTYHQRYLYESRIVAPILQQDPSFANLEISEVSNGGINLSGTVPTAVDKQRLGDLISKNLGEHRREDLLRLIDITSDPESSKSF